MLRSLVAFAALALGQAPQPPRDDPSARTIAPFVGPDAVAIAHIALAPDNIRALSTLLMGTRPTGYDNEQARLLSDWSDRLRRAGAGELFLIVNLNDLSGLPVVVVAPIRPGADAAQLSRVLCGGRGSSAPVDFPTCATLHDAVVAGTPAAIERIRGRQPAQRPELSAAFAAMGGEGTGVRFVVLPSPETRRVLEELVPELPRELGGGPITDWTRGVAWAAVAMSGVQPSLRAIVAATSPEAARALERRGPSLVEFLKKSPIERDVAGLFSRINVDVQGDHLRLTADADVAAGLIESVCQPLRESTAHYTCVNNEKQIALAIHNYISSTHGKFLLPPAYTTGKDGRLLLSWRVLILPYLEQQALFKEFHLDEPWDSPHNKTLIAKMPEVYRCPLESAQATREGKTRYLAPRGAGTVFRGAEPVSLREITDGSSNTILFFDAGDERAVTWTRPDDWDVPAADEADLKGVLNTHRGRTGRGTNFAFTDGSVRFLKDSIKAATLRALSTFAGNEVISSDDP